MRKPFVVGILKEIKLQERRTPLTPTDVLWLRRRGIQIEVQSSRERAFRDKEYERAGARVVEKFNKATLLIGVKEPRPNNLYPNKIYMVFSHTIKGSKKNMPLLLACLQKGITLVDYEKIEDAEGKRLVYFGKFAGICGAIDTLSLLGKRLAFQGIDNPFLFVNEARLYKSLHKAKSAVAKVARKIRRKGLQRRIVPFIIGITGHGNVSRGVQEIIDILKPVEIHPKDMMRFVKDNRNLTNKVCKIVFDREEKLQSKNRSGFYFEEYLKHPKRFESNMGMYLPHVNVLFNTSYWDRRFPRLVTKEMIYKMSKKPSRLVFIADLACDVNGGIELTYKTTSVDNPTYTYDPVTKKYTDGFEGRGISILSRDNLPSELPKESSQDFSKLIREYVYQIALHGALDLTNHIALPREVRNAVIIQDHKLTKAYKYLRKSLENRKTKLFL